jgi:hypothetical protein
MLIKHDPPQYEMLGSLGQYENLPSQRQRGTNMHEALPADGTPAGSLPADQPRPWSEEDTPVYWQTVQAMSAAWRRRNG